MKDSIKLGYKWDLLNILLLLLITSFALSKPAIKFVSDGVENISEINTSYPGKLNDLFANNSSIGVLAICAAEGNCEIDGSRTKLYSGHVDPGNSVENFGWCSNQGRDRGNLDIIDAGCLKRTRSRIPRLIIKLQNHSIYPEQNIEVFINNLDQWNQASPRVSDAFPKKYADALKKGLEGKEAILWARVEAFRKSDGELEAGNSRVGLFSICANYKNTYYTTKLQQYSMWSERWRWNCIALDQRRRLEAINQVLMRNENSLNK
jgi:D-alanyl-D-alanine dipeptidase